MNENNLNFKKKGIDKKRKKNIICGEILSNKSEDSSHK